MYSRYVSYSPPCIRDTYRIRHPVFAIRIGFATLYSRYVSYSPPCIRDTYRIRHPVFAIRIGFATLYSRYVSYSPPCIRDTYRIRHPVFAIRIVFATWCIRSSPSSLAWHSPVEHFKFFAIRPWQTCLPKFQHELNFPGHQAAVTVRKLLCHIFPLLSTKNCQSFEATAKRLLEPEFS